MIVAQFAVLLFACVPDSSDELDKLGNLLKKSQKLEAVITAADGDTLTAAKFANKGYTSLKFEDGHKVIKIAEGAFEGNKLTELELPGTIVTIEKNAFKGNPLTKLILSAIDVEKIGFGAFETTEENLEIELKGIISNANSASIANKFSGKKTYTFTVHESKKDDGAVTASIPKDKVLEDIADLKTVSFDSREGSSVSPRYVASGDTIAKPISTREGYTLEGWFYRNRDGVEDAFDFANNVDSDLALYAKWVEVKASIASVAFEGSAPRSSYYKTGDKIPVAVTFSESVTVNGAPQIAVKVGNEEKQAAYTSGSGTTKLVFEYTVAPGDSDTDGIEIEANKFTLNSGSITGDGGNALTALTHTAVSADGSRKVDTTVPTIASVAFEGSAPRSNSYYRADDIIRVAVTFSESVTVSGAPQIAVKVGNAERQAAYTRGSGTTKLVFGYTVASDDSDNDGIEIEANKFTLNSASITDVAGNALTALTHTAVSADGSRKVDTTAPTINSVAFTSSPQSDDTYGDGEKIQVTVAFSESVTVNGAPQIAVKVGNEEKQAAYTSGSETTNLVFEYTVSAGDSDDDGIEIEANKFTLNSGSITDVAGNALAALTHTAVSTDNIRKVRGATR